MPRTIKLVNGKVKVLEDPVDLTWEERFKAALRETRRAGVKVRQNVRECCRSCVDLDKLGLANWDVPHVWTYGGQGSAYRWGADGVPYYYPSGRGWRYTEDERLERIYFNHGGPGVVAATALVDAMKAQGITVEWNGSEGQCPQIITPYGVEELAKREAAEKKSRKKPVQV